MRIKHSAVLAFCLVFAGCNAINQEIDRTVGSQREDISSQQDCISESGCRQDVQGRNNAMNRSKSGSRLSYKEYKLSDGSIYADPLPFDNKYQEHCSFYSINNINRKCCIPPSIIMTSNLYDAFKDRFLDSGCTIQINSLSYDSTIVVPSPEGCIKSNDYISAVNKNPQCVSNLNLDIYYVEKISSVYQGTPDHCVEIPNIFAVQSRLVSEEEVKSSYVCMEE